MQEGMDGDLERERKRKYLAYQREYRQKAKAAKQKKEEERIKNLMRVRRHRAKRFPVLNLHLSLLKYLSPHLLAPVLVVVSFDW